MAAVHDPSAWRLRYDIATARLLIWVANPTGRAPLQPEIHLYLADRYGRLSRHHANRGRPARAQRLADRSAYHYDLGGGSAPPPAAAMAMPVPRSPVYTRAGARRNPFRAEGPDDAA